jgi:BirA family transcriptional regulator, biotin operon repressor / biotin---[acetyl-CoA-carboxylase] ligase
MQQPKIGANLTILTSVDSSNNYAMQHIYDGKAAHGNAYLALEQTNGKGQYNKHWLTGSNNLALSIVVEPYFLNLNTPFLMHCYVCTSLLQVLNSINTGFCIKWPNDIYFNDRKAAGILIENKIKGTLWQYAVVGIGLNVNDNEIQQSVFNAISLLQITNTEYNVEQLANQLLENLEKNWLLFKKNPACFFDEYNNNLYKKGEKITLEINGVIEKVIMQKVNENGLLICGDNNELAYKHGECKWVQG